ncbi:MAG TPA: TIGR03936 family radical SAM-associated protein [Nocardioides sp.]|uniref:TIGR03936 family radical SAM-associated protein n=1 Tax=Nocardioides sp. TaxID=35761 RepID=UPI002E34BC34|nr:TIGR03936 family radical SAM-associated protein [Nocardioides sp.]HEX3931903.1 TIGR03936 family radical SAM-associated protein [Nocardioides sp.]
MRDQPEQQAPPVQRLRVRYAKRGRLRFTSHRDFSRAFERALVRARIPMAYSSGFNPHPRISYAGASPTGAASEAEYLEIGLADTVDPGALAGDLDQALPDGLDVLEVVVATPGSLADRLQASRWQIDVALPPDTVAPAVAAFWDSESVRVERMTKKGLRAFDSREAVLALDVEAHDVGGVAGTRITALLRHLVPAVRPDDVLAGVSRVGGLDDLGTPWVTRLQQGPLDEARGTIGDPLAG